MTEASLKFNYLNANHCQCSTINAVASANENNIDILLMTEPYYPTYTNRVYAPGWDMVCGPRSAILVRRDLEHTPQISQHNDVVMTQVGETLIICAYSSPNEDNTEILLYLHDAIASTPKPVILAGDFNCTTSFIPGYTTNARGLEFETLITQAVLTIQNNTQPTWRRGDQYSINDYVCTRGREVTLFRVHLDDSHSDHFLISFTALTEATK